eukprot:365747-Chlamydomonas_euryale.AAC.70
MHCLQNLLQGLALCASTAIGTRLLAGGGHAMVRRIRYLAGGGHAWVRRVRYLGGGGHEMVRRIRHLGGGGHAMLCSDQEETTWTTGACTGGHLRRRSVLCALRDAASPPPTARTKALRQSRTGRLSKCWPASSAMRHGSTSTAFRLISRF